MSDFKKGISLSDFIFRTSDTEEDGMDMRKEAREKETVVFGNYAGQEIAWLVLAETDEKQLLISRDALDARAYHDRQEPATWENCSLREWLNEDFYREAFTDEERAKICLTEVCADDNPEWKVDPGSDTEDHIFLLSIKEAEQYFDADGDRICRPTQHALDQGAWYAVEPEDYEGVCNWWLRTPGYAPRSEGYLAAFVHFTGAIKTNGIGTYNHKEYCVRPAMWVKKE